MTGLDLRPLSLGEVLDRTFSLYRRHFLLFVGIAAIPHVLILGVTLAQVAVLSKAPSLALNLAGLVVFIIVYLFAYLFSQGGTIFAVSDLYLGHPTSISDSLRRVWGDFGFLFGVVVLNGLAVGGALLLLVIPGIYVACRLLVCVPSALEFLLHYVGRSALCRQSPASVSSNRRTRHHNHVRLRRFESPYGQNVLRLDACCQLLLRSDEL